MDTHEDIYLPSSAATLLGLMSLIKTLLVPSDNASKQKEMPMWPLCSRPACGCKCVSVLHAYVRQVKQSQAQTYLHTHTRTHTDARRITQLHKRNQDARTISHSHTLSLSPHTHTHSLAPTHAYRNQEGTPRHKKPPPHHDHSRKLPPKVHLHLGRC